MSRSLLNPPQINDSAPPAARAVFLQYLDVVVLAACTSDTGCF